MEYKYFIWLFKKIETETTSLYSILIRQLWAKEFYWLIEMDKNRADDGIDLRREYCDEKNRNLDELNEILGPCRVLEMLIALCIRGYSSISYQKTGITLQDFFWIMIKNLKLERFSKKYDGQDMLSEIDDILNDFLSGKIPLFPGENMPQNCHKIATKLPQNEELWNQMNQFIIKNRLFATI